MVSAEPGRTFAPPRSPVPTTTHPLLAALDLQGITLTAHQRDRLAILFAHHDQQQTVAADALRTRIVQLEDLVQRFEELVDSMMR